MQCPTSSSSSVVTYMHWWWLGEFTLDLLHSFFSSPYFSCVFDLGTYCHPLSPFQSWYTGRSQNRQALQMYSSCWPCFPVHKEKWSTDNGTFSCHLTLPCAGMYSVTVSNIFLFTVTHICIHGHRFPLLTFIACDPLKDIIQLRSILTRTPGKSCEWYLSLLKQSSFSFFLTTGYWREQASLMTSQEDSHHCQTSFVCYHCS